MSGPKVLNLPVGSHYICICGRTEGEPFCDGSHEGTSKAPQLVEIKEPAKVAVCQCGKSKNQPFCDGSHKA